MMRYSDTLVRHFRNPSRVGTLSGDTSGLGTARVGDAQRGGLIDLQIRLDTRCARILDARFKAYGCGATIAAASWVCEWLPGHTPEQVDELRDATISKALTLPPQKVHCAVLAATAARAAVADGMANNSC